ncbi:heparinase II/III family protein [Vibrio splendidus]
MQKNTYGNVIVAFIISIFIFFAIFFSGYVNEIQKKNVGEEIFQFDKRAFDYNYKFNKKTQNTSKRDVELLELGFLSFQNGYSDFRKIEYNDIDIMWNDVNLFSSNTHEYQAHSLFVLSDVLKIEVENKSFGRVHYVERIISSWFEENKRFALNNNQYSWNDHTVANRLVNVIFVYEYYRGMLSQDIQEIIKSMISSHTKFLFNDINYVRGNNHGIFQDLALLFSYRYLSELDMKIRVSQKALERLSEQFKETFSDKNVHLENSSAYHLTVTGLFELAAYIIERDGLDVGRFPINRVEKAKKIRGFFLNSDFSIMPIGDSAFPEYRPELSLDHQLETIELFDNQSGFHFYRNGYFNVIARAGGGLKTHRHDDQGAVYLSSVFGEVLTEFGFYDYSGDHTSKYAKSAFSHNAPIFIKENGKYQSYNCLNTSEKSIQLSCFDHNAQLFERKVNFGSDYVVINDKFQTDEKAVYYFRVGEGFSVINNDACTLESKNLSIRFMSKNPSLKCSISKGTLENKKAVTHVGVEDVMSINIKDCSRDCYIVIESNNNKLSDNVMGFSSLNNSFGSDIKGDYIKESIIVKPKLVLLLNDRIKYFLYILLINTITLAFLLLTISRFQVSVIVFYIAFNLPALSFITLVLSKGLLIW